VTAARTPAPAHAAAPGPTAARTVVVTGSSSGIGRATAERLTARGARVVTVDIRDADIVADLGDAKQRQGVAARVAERTGGSVDGVVTSAGLGGLPSRPGSAMVAVNYFGTVEVLGGLRPLLAKGRDPAAVVLSSNSITSSADISIELIGCCLDGDEAAAMALADDLGSMAAYPAVKTALARWVRRSSTTAEWIGAGICLNGVAPGMVDTAMNAEGRRDPIKAPMLEAFPIPVGRMGRPEEIAAVIDFLLGAEARFFCGSVLFADGGTDALRGSAQWPIPLQPRS
jgi:NAD(P)-dependent dehydrogenase (short-subunit alcohol dehydrogenase family)